MRAPRAAARAAASRAHAEEIDETEGPLAHAPNGPHATATPRASAGALPGGRGTGGGGGVGASADLAAGLAVHTRALLTARQAAVAGLALAEIDARLGQYALEHAWGPGGGLADFAALQHRCGGGVAAAAWCRGGGGGGGDGVCVWAS